MPDRRPDPDKLLARVKEEEIQTRGKLKIYLGAAPGVGKTYNMLQDAITKRDQGLDVVAGVVESHGRKEILSLLKKLDILPRQKIDYHGRLLEEFDLDAALNRNPSLILMDEMAHTNVPGLRHAKRWQDIKELLDRGIDVYTTLNVQHIESLNDVVAQILGIKVRETVPDSLLELADTIELIDLPPDDLLRRLQEGKVYIPEQVELATNHFFRKGNLIALRELALRFTAERVNDQVLSHRQGQGIEKTWATTERLLVCVGPQPESAKVIRAARRMASSLHAEWIAVYVEVPHLQTPEEERNRAIQNLRLAEQLGAETRTLSGLTIAKEILNFASEQNITKIIMGKPARPRWRHILFGSLGDDIARKSGSIDIYMIHGEETHVVSGDSYSANGRIPWRIYGFALGMVALTTLLAIPLAPYLGPTNVIMIYLLSIVVVAMFGAVGPAFFASLLSVIACDFFFIPPIYSFFIMDWQYFFTLLVMFFVAHVISHLTIIRKRQTDITRIREKRTADLHALTRQLASTRGIDQLLEITVRHLSNVFNSDVMVLLPEGDHLMIRAGSEKDKLLTTKEQGVAQWVYDMGQMAGLGTETLPFTDAVYIPLIGSRTPVGILKVRPKQSGYLFTPEQLNLLEACANQVALAIEVDRLQGNARETQTTIEAERLRTAMFSSLSRELQGPLASIIQSVESLQEKEADLKQLPLSTWDLIQHITQETAQLHKIINNLLQISELEAGKMALHKEPVLLNGVIGETLNRLKKKLDKRTCKVDLPENMQPATFDKVLIEQVLVNLLENALLYTPKDSPIEISASLSDDSVLVAVADHGPGLMLMEEEKVFEKFYRGQQAASGVGGGLGLAVCQSIIKAHGGRIWAENRMSGGAIFYFILPLL